MLLRYNPPRIKYSTPKSCFSSDLHTFASILKKYRVWFLRIFSSSSHRGSRRHPREKDSRSWEALFSAESFVKVEKTGRILRDFEKSSRNIIVPIAKRDTGIIGRANLPLALRESDFPRRFTGRPKSSRDTEESRPDETRRINASACIGHVSSSLAKGVNSPRTRSYISMPAIASLSC